ncbi:MAG: DsbA family protein [Myxococcota bacterium]|nr:DsbA family protein [Myxococcota bacterium]
MRPVRLEVWSDYLCPWCYNAAHRLERLDEEYGSDLELEWKSYLLRPRPEERDLHKFVRYTQSWLRPASEADAPVFRVWESTEGPPSHSVPPHVVAKAAARLDGEAFRSLHRALLAAYFEKNRDITATPVLRDLWAGAGLAADAFDEAVSDASLLDDVVRQHREAQERGMTGVPSVGVRGHDGFVMGAQPLDVYRRWIDRLLDGVLDA